MKKLFLVVVALFVAGIFSLFMFGGGKNYNTDFPPPSAGAQFIDIVPETIDGVGHKIGILPLGSKTTGIKSEYAVGTSITIINSSDLDVIDTYATKIADGLEGFSSRSSGKFNDAWSIKASGAKGRIYAWQQQNWFYSIKAPNDVQFEEIVENLPISKMIDFYSGNTDLFSLFSIYTATSKVVPF